MFLPIIPSVSPNKKSGSILPSPKNSKVDPLRCHLSSISQQNLSAVFLSLQPWLTQYRNDEAGSPLCNNRQHYIVGVPQGSVFGPSVVLNISKKVFFSAIIVLSFSIFAMHHINSHTCSKITVSLGLLTTAALVKEMEPLFQPAKRSHPQDRSVTVNSYIICLPLVQENRNNNRNLSNTAEPAQPFSLIKSPD